jgi:hypothetical protein
MAIKTIPLSDLEMDLATTLNECVASGETLVVEMPGDRLVAIHPLDPTDDDDDLINQLLSLNPRFQQLVAKSNASSRKPFSTRS